MDAKHKAQLFHDLETIHIPLGRQVFPLVPGTKIPPKNFQWRTRKLSSDQIRSFVDTGHNLAWALGPQDVVLDVDIDPQHRNAVGSLKKLGGFLGIAPNFAEWLSATAVVLTGGADGGQHYYMTVPPNVKINTTHPDYPDLHWRRHGNYVVLPGSLHPDGRYYDWDYFSRYDERPMAMPPKLLELFRAETYQKKESKHAQNISVDELRHYLYQLDPKELFRDRQSWVELGFIVHNTLGESGRGLFMQWSAQDDLYRDTQTENDRIWDSIKDDKSNNLGFGSLVRKVLDSGGTPYRLPAAKEFDDGFNLETQELDAFLQKIAKMPPERDFYIVKQIIQEAKSFGPILWESKLKSEIAHCLGMKERVIDKLYKLVNKETKKSKIDYPERIAQNVLTKQFDSGKTLIHAINQRFYHYPGTHWIPLQDNEITTYLYNESKNLKNKNGATHDAATKVPAALTALIAKTTKINNDVFDFSGRVKSIINCANGELHLDTDTGQFEFQRHSPQSYLLQCLATPFDPDAKCPIWDAALMGIFRDHQEPTEMIRHLWEIFGYIIQPQKDIASWFLWLGYGLNGKSITLEILQSLMGEKAYLPRPIEDFANSGRSNHAIASLVGKLAVVDDDANTEKALPSSVLKKLAEGRVWESNPKHKDTFNFRAAATPVVLFNGYPKIKDITWGMLRKIFVVPFKRQFVRGVDEDTTIRPRVQASELSGALNRALDGLQRLRKRGSFQEPVDCVQAKNQWLRRAHQVIDWLHERCVLGNGSWSSVENLYISYQLWAENNHRKYKYSLTDLESNLLQYGLKIENRKNLRGFAGIEVKQ